MPRATKARTSLPGHAKAARLQQASPEHDDVAMDLNMAEEPQHDSDTAIPSNESRSTASPPHPTTLTRTKPLTKSDKQWAKHQALLQKINASQLPYSKSHARRLKRAAMTKNNLCTTLSDVKRELDLVQDDDNLFDNGNDSTRHDSNDDADGQSHDDDDAHMDSQVTSNQTKPTTGGKGQPKLTAKKRNKVLTSESARLPAVLANSSFSANPFATIREHARNTMAMQKQQQQQQQKKKNNIAANR
ncbi:hypothetical protein OIO90_001158 [Microbotryomycetes sp. JL221]|nr:hypothetical protein OIO90_001158 [Microbotryomycetes sp. JL221]